GARAEGVPAAPRSRAPRGAGGGPLEPLFAVAYRPLEVRVQGDPDARPQGRRAIVRDVRDDAPDALVDQPDRARGEDPAQVVIGGLRAAAVVHDAPARAGDEVAQPQDQAAAARRPGPTPLPVDLLHDLSAHRPARPQ